MEEKLNIYQKMSKITEEINRIAKNLQVGIGKSSYKAVGEADVLAEVKPIEIKYGVYSYPIKRETELAEKLITTVSSDYGDKEKLTIFIRIKTTYRFVNIENPQEFIDIDTYGDGVDSQDKAPGKAMTYADKYALLKAYKIETGDDPDQNESKPMKSYNKNDFNKVTSVKKEWTFEGGRFKGLTMEQASERPDFNEYLEILKSANKFTKDIEEEYNKLAKIKNLSGKIEEVEI